MATNIDIVAGIMAHRRIETAIDLLAHAVARAAKGDIVAVEWCFDIANKMNVDGDLTDVEKFHVDCTIADCCRIADDINGSGANYYV